ncbi:MAG: DUF4837 family protein [Bacteroidales bacterium]
MKTLIYRSIVPFIILAFLFGCKQEESSRGDYTSKSSGKPGSVLVVVDSTKFNGNIGTSIKKTLSQVFKGLPQPEPLFEMTDIHPDAYKKIFRKHRNILKVEVGSNYEETQLLIKKDVYAKPQLIIHAQAPDDSAMVHLFREKRDRILNEFLDAERNRYLRTYKGAKNNGVMERVREKFGVELVIPKGYSLDVDTTDFVWIADEGEDYSKGILIYQKPYKDETDLTKHKLIELKDRFTKKFVPGPSPKSYMMTEPEIDPFFEEETVNGNDVVIMRGLWRVKNDFMGGPFITFSFTNKDKTKVITVEGFLYAPKLDKRNHVRKLEAILYSLDLN